MITGHIFKALIAVNCLKVAVKQGRLNRRSGIWDASGKMSKAGRGGERCCIPKRENGECEIRTLPNPVNLEYRAYTNLVVFGYLLLKQGKGYIASLSHRGVFSSFQHSIYLAYCCVCICVSQRSKIKNDFM